MPTDTLTDESPGAPDANEQDGSLLAAPRALAPGDIAPVEFDPAARLPFPPRERGVASRALPKPVAQLFDDVDRDLTRIAVRLAATPARRRRASLMGSLVFNAALLTLLAIYGRVQIFVPNKPASSISVVFVDLPPAAVPDLRDPEVAPEPEPEPAPELEVLPEPEPLPAPEPEPPAEPEPEDEPEPEPPLDLTPEPAFTRPSEVEPAPFIPDAARAAAPQTEEQRPGDIPVDGEQAPADEAAPLVTVEPEAREARAEKDAGDEDEEDKDDSAGERAAGDDERRDQAPVAEIKKPEAEKPAGDDSFDEEPVFTGRRFSLPQVDLPEGDTPARPGTSGVMAIFCPEEFTDKEKAAECAGRTEIRSGWRPGSSGEDFSKAASILKQRSRDGDFSGDAVTFGPEIARAAADRARLEDLEDFRRGQAASTNAAGIAPDPGAASRPDLLDPAQEPSWTRREDPLVDEDDVEKLRKDLEEAERRNGVDDN
ncbi:MAG: hypothetical protein ACKVS5_00360 [Parvularculaceae bacterium]